MIMVHAGRIRSCGYQELLCRFSLGLFLVLSTPMWLFSQEESVKDKADPDKPVEPTVEMLIHEIQVAYAQGVESLSTKMRMTYTLKEESIEKAQLEVEADQRRLESKTEKAFQNLVKKFPESAEPSIALGNFYDDLGKEHQAFDLWTKASKINPKDPSIWNNLAGYHTHNGKIMTSFQYFEKVMTLKPDHWIYYHNFGNAVFLFRKDAKEYFSLDEQGVFNRAFELFEQALEKAPQNFELAQDIANSYYIVRPFRSDAAIKAWEKAGEIAASPEEKQSVLIHLARWYLRKNDVPQALKLINQVTHPELITLKKRVKKNILKQREDI